MYISTADRQFLSSDKLQNRQPMVHLIIHVPPHFKAIKRCVNCTHDILVEILTLHTCTKCVEKRRTWKTVDNRETMGFKGEQIGTVRMTSHCDAFVQPLLLRKISKHYIN